MRTDAKIGFAIGGVLLAVLTVYAIVVPKHSKKTAGNVTLVTTPESSEPVGAANPTPPIAAAGVNAPVTIPSAQADKDKETTAVVVTPPVPATPDTGASQPVDSTFHPTTPRELAKVDDQSPVKINDGGVYTPDPEMHPKTAKARHTTAEDPSLPVVAASHDYVIQQGQTLSSIALDVYGNSRFWVAIQRENKGLDANHLKVGSKIKLPDGAMVRPGPIVVDDVELAAAPASHKLRPAAGSETYTVQAGDNLYRISKKLFGNGRRADALYALNRDLIGPDKAKLRLGTVLAVPASQPVASAAN